MRALLGPAVSTGRRVIVDERPTSPRRSSRDGSGTPRHDPPAATTTAQPDHHQRPGERERAGSDGRGREHPSGRIPLAAPGLSHPDRRALEQRCRGRHTGACRPRHRSAVRRRRPRIRRPRAAEPSSRQAPSPRRRGLAGPGGGLGRHRRKESPRARQIRTPVCRAQTPPAAYRGGGGVRYLAHPAGLLTYERPEP